jgi:hypothetical protein
MITPSTSSVVNQNECESNDELSSFKEDYNTSKDDVSEGNINNPDNSLLLKSGSPRVVSKKLTPQLPSSSLSSGSLSTTIPIVPSFSFTHTNSLEQLHLDYFNSCQSKNDSKDKNGDSSSEIQSLTKEEKGGGAFDDVSSNSEHHRGSKSDKNDDNKESYIDFANLSIVDHLLKSDNKESTFDESIFRSSLLSHRPPTPPPPSQHHANIPYVSFESPLVEYGSPGSSPSPSPGLSDLISSPLDDISEFGKSSQGASNRLSPTSSILSPPPSPSSSASTSAISSTTISGNTTITTFPLHGPSSVPTFSASSLLCPPGSSVSPSSNPSLINYFSLNNSSQTLSDKSDSSNNMSSIYSSKQSTLFPSQFVSSDLSSSTLSPRGQNSSSYSNSSSKQAELDSDSVSQIPLNSNSSLQFSTSSRPNSSPSNLPSSYNIKNPTVKKSLFHSLSSHSITNAGRPLSSPQGQFSNNSSISNSKSIVSSSPFSTVGKNVFSSSTANINRGGKLVPPQSPPSVQNSSVLSQFMPSSNSQVSVPDSSKVIGSESSSEGDLNSSFQSDVRNSVKLSSSSSYESSNPYIQFLPNNILSSYGYQKKKNSNKKKKKKKNLLSVLFI